MRPLTPAQVNRILTLLDEGKTGGDIVKITGLSLFSVSKIRSIHRPLLSKSTGGRPRKLSPSDIHYSIRQITSQKAEHATEVAKTLRDMTGESTQ
jgi:hypothetical protein